MGLRLAAFRQTTKLTALILAAITTGAFAFAGGTGQASDPYQIATAEQLMSIGSDPNLLDKHFVLVANIDLDPNLPGRRAFTQAVIAPDANQAEPVFQGVAFTGNFDGRGYTVSNLTIGSSSAHHLGLFGLLARDGSVRNLVLENAAISGGERSEAAGALAGANHGSVVNCCARATLSGRRYIAGLVGYNAGTLLKCHAAVEIQSSHPMHGAAGGLAGSNAGLIATSSARIKAVESTGCGGLVGSNRGAIWCSRAEGEITGGGFLAGLAGSAIGGTVVNCYSLVTVSARTSVVNVGGLVGYYAGGVIVNCYAAGAIRNGVTEAELWDWGGLVGWDGALSPVIVNCFWDTEASGSTVSDGGTGVTTAQMQDANTFLKAGWDFRTVWMICEGQGYPRLQWENVDCAEETQSGD